MRLSESATLNAIDAFREKPVDLLFVSEAYYSVFFARQYRAGGFSGKYFAIDFVHDGAVAHLGEKDLIKRDVIERTVRCFQHSLTCLKYTSGPCPDVAGAHQLSVTVSAGRV